MRHTLEQTPAWLSKCVLFAYLFVYGETLAIIGHVVSARRHHDALVVQAVHHLSMIYLLEVALAAVYGMCTMTGNWTRSELILHHAPYVLAVMMVIHVPGEYDKDRITHWSAAMVASLLTAANEALLIVEALGAPPWVGRARRVYGFSVILSLFSAEISCYISALSRAYVVWAHPSFRLSQSYVLGVAGDHVVTGAIYYHSKLLMMYIRRWCRTKTL
ncbi:hypothetical protein AB1Y20_002763 [Prymnesium parvum]|uniref:Very-long-chain (3R)-3-hydroxyacyl-CoA dehydratase n=1 Tax=Prymnesium parvum TaxID=97485 RepID=A0AB34JBJ2_PRYPA